MGLDLWFREDVMRILASTAETMGATLGAVSPVSPDEASAYHRGFVDALRAVGVAFGVSAPRAASAWQPGMGSRLLEAGEPWGWRTGGSERGV